MALYAANGSINVVVVDGATLTGVHHPSGAWNVVVTELDTLVGLMNPCGAYNVVLAPTGSPVPRTAPNGAWYVTEDAARHDGAMRITVVSGDIGEAALALPTVSEVTIGGVAGVGETLTATVTKAGGASTTSYRWLRDGSNIGGATSQTYDVVSQDLDKEVSVTGTASNVSGTDSLTSAPLLIEPTIEEPEVVVVTDKDVTVTITTNKIKGQFFYVITESATPPTPAQVLAGEDHTGATAVASGRVNVNQLTQLLTNVAADALEAETDYWMYATQNGHKQFTSNIAFIDFTTTA